MKTTRNMLAAVVMIAVVGLWAGGVHAATIAAFDINSGSSPTEPGFTGVSNPLSGGTSGAVSLVVSKANDTNRGYRDRGIGGALATASQQALMRDFYFANGATANPVEMTFDLSGLPASADLTITYFTYNQGAFQRQMSVFEDSSSGTLLATHLTPGNTPDAGNFSFDLTSDTGGNATFVGVGTDPNGSSVIFNGLTVDEAESEPSPAGEPTWKIDVNSGSSPTMPGWTGLNTAAGSGNGSDVTVDGVRFEADSAAGHRDRGGPNDLTRDFIFDDGGPVGIRLWDLPDGLYEARVWSFDQAAQPGTQNVGLGWTGVGPNIIVGQTGPSLDPFVFQFDSRLYADGVGIFTEPASSGDGGNGRARLNALQLTLIPEPATMALLGLAACGLGGYVRRRRSA